jgi:L-alanine-DL-glutamate epimerase-like enolase superfamily enzyme
MRIARIETHSTPDVALARVVDDDGAEGWGQLAPYNADIAATVLHRQVAPHVLGADPRDIAALTDRVLVREHKFPGAYVCRALAGVDTALWDLAGKRAGTSVCELLGGRPRPFPVYGASMRRDITPEAEAERLAALVREQGFGAVKFRVGAVNGTDVDEWPGRTEAIVPAVREAVGDGVALLVDANGGYTPDTAIEIGRMLQDHGVVHFEEPCRYWDLDGTRRVTEALDLDVAGGEQDVAMPIWDWLIGRRVVDVVQPDICYIGGLTRSLRVARMAADAGLPCTPHSANLTLVTVFSLHMMGAIANAGPYVEYSIEPDSYYPFQAGLFEPALTVTDGRVAIPDGPGWGVTINPDWLARAECRVSRPA